MRKTLIACSLLTGCSYSFGGGEGGAGAASNDVTTGFTSAASSVTGQGTSGVTASTSITSTTVASTADTTSTEIATTEQSSASTGQNPVDLPPCGEPWGFGEFSNRWGESSSTLAYRTQDDEAYVQVEYNMSGINRAFITLAPEDLTAQGDCFISMRMIESNGVPRIHVNNAADLNMRVTVAYFFGDSTLQVSVLGVAKTMAVANPDHMGLARYAGKLYLGSQAQGQPWSLVEFDSVPAWLTPGSENALQAFGVGDNEGRYIVMDDYNGSPISTGDIDAAVSWESL